MSISDWWGSIKPIDCLFVLLLQVQFSSVFLARTLLSSGEYLKNKWTQSNGGKCSRSRKIQQVSLPKLDEPLEIPNKFLQLADNMNANLTPENQSTPKVPNCSPIFVSGTKKHSYHSKIYWTESRGKTTSLS